MVLGMRLGNWVWHVEVGCGPETIQTKWDLWNQKTCLRGVNLWQKQIEPKYDGDAFGDGVIGPPYSSQSLKKLAAMGANYVNISFPGLFSERPPYRLIPENVEYLDALLARLEGANLFAVLSFRTGPGRNEAGFDESERHRALHSVWKNRKEQQAWVEMWKYTAQRYRGHPILVGFDLMVEPNSNDVLLKEWDPERFYQLYADSTFDWNPLASRIVQAVRDIDSETPIIVGSMNYSDVGWLSYLPDFQSEKLLFSAHFYEPYAYTHQEPPLRLKYPGYFDADDDGVEDRVDKNWLKERLEPVRYVKQVREIPVVVNEFGLKRWEPGAENYAEDLMYSLEDVGANYALWLWESDYPGINYNEFNFRFGPNHHEKMEISTSRFMQVLIEFWNRNQVRPSNIDGFFSDEI